MANQADESVDRPEEWNLETVSIAIEQAAYKSANFDLELYAAHYVEVRKLLFGVSRTKAYDTKLRWRSARVYYQANLAVEVGRTRDISDANFKRRVYEREILPPMVAALLDWEQMLSSGSYGSGHGEETEIDQLNFAWRNRFRRFFQISIPAETFAAFMAEYLNKKDNDEGETVVATTLDVLDLPDLLECALYELGRLYILGSELDLSGHEVPTYSLLARCRTISWATPDGLRDRLQLTKADAEWLTHSLISQGRRKLDGPLGESFKKFSRLLREEAKGRSVFRRFQALEETCECLTGSASVNDCVFHGLIKEIMGFLEDLRYEWYQISKTVINLPPGNHVTATFSSF
ncbi:hypothetical protein [Amycolatopsis samaneae]|uniref:Uncharacterized protein n=1 Tax=Amycolatopsis samaneae TaxID=664691 RepID=A0ABW5GUK0_9PSEU